MISPQYGEGEREDREVEGSFRIELGLPAVPDQRSLQSIPPAQAKFQEPGTLLSTKVSMAPGSAHLLNSLSLPHSSLLTLSGSNSRT